MLGLSNAVPAIFWDAATPDQLEGWLKANLPPRAGEYITKGVTRAKTDGAIRERLREDVREYLRRGYNARGVRLLWRRRPSRRRRGCAAQGRRGAARVARALTYPSSGRPSRKPCTPRMPGRRRIPWVVRDAGEVQELAAFDPFRDEIAPGLARDRDDAGKHAARARIVDRFDEQRTVDLDEVQAQLAEQLESRIAAAGVVQCHPHPQRAERLRALDDHRLVLDAALGELDDDVARIDARRSQLRDERVRVEARHARTLRAKRSRISLSRREGSEPTRALCVCTRSRARRFGECAPQCRRLPAVPTDQAPARAARALRTRGAACCRCPRWVGTRR